MKVIMRHQNIIEIIIIVAIFIAVNLLSAAFQPQITINEGKGWDALHYYSMAEQLSQGQLPHEEAPYVYRIGTPLLASLFFHDNLLLSFKIINIIANVLATLLLLVWLRLYISNWKIRTLLVVLFIAQWHAPIRIVYYNPAAVDSWFFVFLLAGLIGIHRVTIKPTLINIGILSLITFVGVFFREVIIILPIALLFATNIFRSVNCSRLSVSLGKRPPLTFLIPLIAGIAGMVVVRMITSVQAGEGYSYSFIDEAISWAFDKPLLTYILAWSIAFGPILAVVVYDWRNATKFLADNQFQLVFLILIIVLAWFGGGDTERFIYWSMPVIYILLGKALENNAQVLKAPLIIAVLVLSQCISQRVFWQTPDYPGTSVSSLPILTPIGSHVPYLDLYSLWASRSVAGVSFVEYMCLGLVLLVWLAYRAKKLQKVNQKIIQAKQTET